MAQTTAGGAPYPELPDENNPPADFLALAAHVDKVAAPKFVSTAARNTAFPSPSLGQLVVVSGGLQIWNGTAWADIRANEMVKHGVVNNSANGAVNVSFSPAFPTWCSNVMLVPVGTSARVIAAVDNISRLGFQCLFINPAGGLHPTGTGSIRFTAWGY